ncbi:hypothetical protein OSB04_020287 [Centaurea solstitialis]|uniref:very-long-chain 3-oxoacyl-CoA synthase n=1 Tax=Centaurea solstitialis TaxID=347529 RepID=A0AA38WF32_9ASTR|nr:hypothetical protein OSB04_020287 [Centaurea solstitialis]
MNKTSCKVYLIDFACYKPPVSQQCSKELFLKQARSNGYFPEEMLDFMEQVMDRAGLGDSTYLPEALFGKVYDPSIRDSRREVEMVVFGSVDMLLAKTGVRSEDIGILIVNCCLFNTVPSLSAIVVNRYKLPEDVISYNLTGMGCSAGLLAIGLAKQLLQVQNFYECGMESSKLTSLIFQHQVHRNSYAMIVSTEITTENLYAGTDRSKFIQNCLFRVGAAAILLSNRRSDHHTAKYRLIHTVHTNTSSSDRFYNSVLREEDQAGIAGVTINKDLIAAAAATIRPNLAAVGRLILPVAEKFRYLIKNHVGRKLLPTSEIRPHVRLDFSTAVEHFLPHVGGKPVLDELQRTLGFSDTVMEASRMTLYRFGNTSSSSIWYELAYVEAKGRVRKGDRVWHIAFGSGFKCCSVIWRAMRTVDHDDDKNPWTDEIAEFPVILKEYGGSAPVTGHSGHPVIFSGETFSRKNPSSPATFGKNPSSSATFGKNPFSDDTFRLLHHFFRRTFGNHPQSLNPSSPATFRPPRDPSIFRRHDLFFPNSHNHITLPSGSDAGDTDAIGAEVAEADVEGRREVVRKSCRKRLCMVVGKVAGNGLYMVVRKGAGKVVEKDGGCRKSRRRRWWWPKKSSEMMVVVGKSSEMMVVAGKVAGEDGDRLLTFDSSLGTVPTKLVNVRVYNVTTNLCESDNQRGYDV